MQKGCVYVNMLFLVLILIKICVLICKKGIIELLHQIAQKHTAVGTLLNGVLIPKLLNSPFASWLLINLDFLLPHIAHFDDIIALPLLVLEIFGSMFSVSFYTLNNTISFYMFIIYF